MRFFIYFMRWQLSTLVLMLPMWYFETLGIGAVLNLVICQCIGAFIFYWIDMLIFNKDFTRKIKLFFLKYKYSH